MNAIEFTGVTHNGVLELPKKFRSWDGKHVRVILLIEEQASISKDVKHRDAIETLLKNPRRTKDATPLSRATIYDR